MSSFLDRVRSRMSGSLNRVVSAPKPKRPTFKSRDIILLNRWDQRAWDEARKTPTVDKLIDSLANGDTHRGGSRPPFEAAPELVKATWASLYKASPTVEDKRNLHREVYPAKVIIEELLANESLLELQEMTATDSTMSTMALKAMEEVIGEIISRLPPPPPPPQPKGKPQKNEDGDGEGEDGQPGQPGPGSDGKGEPDDDGEGEGNGGGSDGQPNEQDGDEPGDGVGGQAPKDDQQPEQQTPQAPQAPGEPGDPDDEDGDDEDGDGDADPDDEPDEDDGDEGEDDEEGEGQEFEPDLTPEEQAEADWQDAYDKLADGLDLDRAVNNALDAAHEAAKELDDTRRGIGLDDGTWQQMSPEARLAMAERLNSPAMKSLADMVGRMKRFALGVRATRINDVPHEPYDVTSGDDLRHLLKSEYALLATKPTSYEFYRRLADKELLQYKLRGTEDAGKGPIVICIDKSGSMNGKPFDWAMGVAEALRRFAADEGRDYHAIFFGNNHDRNRFDFPGGKGPFEKVLAFLSVLANGGTQFDGVLTEALATASTAFDGDGKGKADIVFLTDGEAHLDDRWIAQFNAERERVGVRLFAVRISGAYDLYGRQSGSVLDKVADAVINVSELRPESVREVFAKV